MKTLVERYGVDGVKRAIERTFFDVEKTRNGNLRFPFTLRNGLTGQSITDVSERYTLVKNRDIVSPFLETFGVERLEGLTAYNSRRSYLYTFGTGRTFNFGTDENPDIIRERLIIGNSYDKTKAFSFMFGAFRFVCSNGLYTGKAVIAYKKIHVGEIPLSSMISAVLENYSRNAFDLWRDFAKKPLTLAEEKALIDAFQAYDEKETDGVLVNAPKSGNRLLNDRIRYTATQLIAKPESVDNARNAWGLFNQLNRAIAYNVPQGSVNKIIAGNVTAENYLSALVTA